MEVASGNIYLQLWFKAAARGNWPNAKRILEEYPAALTATKVGFGDTALHIACRGYSNELIQNLVNMMSEDEVAILNKYGETPLHCAAASGNTEAAKILVGKNSTLTQRRNIFNSTPLHLAALFRVKEILDYLLLVTRDENPSPFSGSDGIRLVNSLIISDFDDIVFDLLKRYPELEGRREGHNANSELEGAGGNVHLQKWFKAAARGDWPNAKRILEEYPAALTAKRDMFGDTALHIAVSAGHSNELVQNLVDMMSEDELAIMDFEESTSLHNAALGGNTKAAKILVTKDPTLTQRRNRYNNTPLHIAAIYAHRETVGYLLLVTLNENPSPFSDKDGSKLVNSLIIADFYDIALDLLKRYPALARGRDEHFGNSALDVLATRAHSFASGSRLGCCQRLLDHCWSKIRGSPTIRESIMPKDGDVEDPSKERPKQFRFLQQIENRVSIHKQAMELLKFLISESFKSSESEAQDLLAPSTRTAASVGIHEFVAVAIRHYPSVVLLADANGNTIFQLAVKYRQEKVFNLLYQMGYLKRIITGYRDNLNNNMLHLAGKLNPSNKISGAALQMQRELQWFKEVEKFVQPSYKTAKNNEGKTPRMVFTEEHKILVEKGEKWMKETATSCATVAALVITVAFAAAFTVPGGNNSDQGIPIYLNQTAFIIFAISDALGLFSSSTSLLMFLGILTSRYSEEDFLKALPMRLSIGLITLFFSIASMLAAFSAAFHLVLFHRVKWIVLPVGLMSCVPITLFALLQFPLLVEIVYSTFGPSVFRKQSNEIIF